MDSATRYGSCVPVTTIGIAPKFGPETSGRRIRRLTCKCSRQRHGGALKADIPHMTWFASIRMLLQHFPRKVGLHGPARRCVSGVKAVYRPLCSSRHLPDAREQQQRIPACPLRQDKYCEAKKFARLWIS